MKNNRSIQCIERKSTPMPSVTHCPMKRCMRYVGTKATPSAPSSSSSPTLPQRSTNKLNHLPSHPPPPAPFPHRSYSLVHLLILCTQDDAHSPAMRVLPLPANASVPSTIMAIPLLSPMTSTMVTWKVGIRRCVLLPSSSGRLSRRRVS